MEHIKDKDLILKIYPIIRDAATEFNSIFLNMFWTEQEKYYKIINFIEGFIFIKGFESYIEISPFGINKKSLKEKLDPIIQKWIKERKKCKFCEKNFLKLI